MDLVTIKAFNSLPEAHMAKAMLEADGIPAFLADDATADMFHLTSPFGEAKVQVAGEHAERARRLLDSAERGHGDPLPDDGGDAGEGQ